jgi:cell division protein FtsQ
MQMNKAWNIVIATVMWCAIVAYVVMAGRYSQHRRSKITVTAVHTRVVDSASLGLVNSAKLSQWLAEGGFVVKGKPLAEVDTRAIERHIESHGEVRTAHAWVDLDGILTVEVTQRKPIMRVFSANGYRFWVTDDNYILPDKSRFTAYVPVVTGHTPFPFGVSVKDSYDAILQGVWDDFLDQFTKLEEERRQLVVQRRSERAQISVIRNKRAGYIWSKKRKEAFAEEKQRQITPHQQKIAELDDAMVTLAARKTALRAKEKKSQQTHAFLTKLVTFVKSVEADGFWASQIVQINVLGSGEGGWREPLIELIPRVGDHTVLLGTLDGEEMARLEKLRLFYSEGLSHHGWDSARHIDIRYQDQIVCTK